MNADAFTIEVGDVSDVEARVVIRCRMSDIELHGTLRGPYCERAHTLPAEYPFRAIASGDGAAAEAVVTDPCLWSEELPHVYRVDVAAMRGGETIAEYHDTIGLRRTRPAPNWDHIK